MLLSCLASLGSTYTLPIQTCGTASNLKRPSAAVDSLGNALFCRCAAGLAAVTPTCDFTTFASCPVDVCSINCQADGLAPSSLTSGCVNCSSTTLGLGASGDCACFVGSSGTSALVETAATDSTPGFKTCVPCPNRTLVFAVATGYRRADLSTCQSCADPHASMQPDGSCACDAGYTAAGIAAYTPDHGVTCVPRAATNALSSYPANAAAIITFYAVQVSVDDAPPHAATSLIATSSPCSKVRVALRPQRLAPALPFSASTCRQRQAASSIRVTRAVPHATHLHSYVCFR